MFFYVGDDCVSPISGVGALLHTLHTIKLRAACMPLAQSRQLGHASDLRLVHLKSSTELEWREFVLRMWFK